MLNSETHKPRPTPQQLANREALSGDSCGRSQGKDELSLFNQTPPPGDPLTEDNYPECADFSPRFTYDFTITKAGMDDDQIRKDFSPLFSLVEMFNDAQKKNYAYNQQKVIRNIERMIGILNAKLMRVNMSVQDEESPFMNFYNTQAVPYCNELEKLLGNNSNFSAIMQGVLDEKLTIILEYLGYKTELIQTELVTS